MVPESYLYYINFVKNFKALYMLPNLKEIFTVFMVLFAVIDIIGNIPIIIDLRKKSRSYSK